LGSVSEYIQLLGSKETFLKKQSPRFLNLLIEILAYEAIDAASFFVQQMVVFSS
jgi:hypothetical protein